MNPRTTEPTTAAEIRAVIDAFLDAVRAQDLARIGSYYASEVRAFDAVNRLEFRGREAYLKHWADCLAVCPGPSVFDLDHLEIEAGGDLAVSHGLLHCGGVDETGEEKTAWMRVTVTYRKVGGRWQIVHEHYSMPFDMKTGQMLCGLTP
ncbi:MAG TPA: nuclear transport factor 2 family protein [Candidatus Krumholzibacteria bacterium]|nr:nuclear transport factor 2 family protein [Candidatus Krumholzibacteria bacterium]HPD73259.1 nuclear transport factor 2 family protein [Candidatus Krumholzibacteria bacterium]HRY40221.1 nuclear transport factor 2 family protein [Candidatus Krumholzibacteria bacterium]